MKTKQCTRCNKTKELSDFYKDRSKQDGYKPQCKSCWKIIESSPTRKKSILAYKKTEKYKATIRKCCYNWYKKHPHIKKARAKVSNAIRDGRLPDVKSTLCIQCGSQAEEYHHDSYDKDKWLNVKSLCVKCHKEYHRSKIREY